MNWRNEIDPVIRNHVEARIKQSAEDREALLEAKKPREAQLWITLGHLSREMSDMNLRLKFLEKALTETLKSKKKKTRSKKEQKEIDDIVKTLNRL